MVSVEQPRIVPTEPIPAKSLVIKTDKPRPYVCATCTRSFARLEHLKRHERSHTKEKPFQCPVCERSFARRDLLLRHKQKLHANYQGTGGRESKGSNSSGHHPLPMNPTSQSRHASVCVPGRQGVTLGPNSAFSPFSLNPLEHELMGGRPDESTVDPAMLGNWRPRSHSISIGVQQFNPYESPESDSPFGVPYTTPPTEHSMITPLPWQDTPDFSAYLGPDHMTPSQQPPVPTPQVPTPHTVQPQQLLGIDNHDDFVSSLLDLDDRFNEPTNFGGFGVGFSSALKDQHLDSELFKDYTQKAHRGLPSSGSPFSMPPPPAKVQTVQTQPQPAPQPVNHGTSRKDSAALPSSQDVPRLVAAYYQHFNPHVHFIHRSTELNSQNMALVMSMAAVGALFLGERETARRVFDVGRDCIHMFSDLNQLNSSESVVPIRLVQASTLSLFYELFDKVGTPQHLYAESKKLATMAQGARLNLPPSQVIGKVEPKASVEEKWKHFLECQKRIRTMYAVHCVTSLVAIILGEAPTVPTQSLVCGSPCDEALLACTTAQEWWDVAGKRQSMDDTEGTHFNQYLMALLNGQPINETVPPITLMNLICAIDLELRNRRARNRDLSVECQQTIIRAWETTWSRSPFATLDPTSQHGPILADCAPIASLALMHVQVDTTPLLQRIWNNDPAGVNRELDRLRLESAEHLVDASGYALDAISVAHEQKKCGVKMFLPTLAFLFESGFVLSQSLAVIESLVQPTEKHQRLLMRAHKVFSQIMDSNMYPSLLNFHDPSETLSHLALRVTAAVLQSNQWPITNFMADTLLAERNTEQIFADSYDLSHFTEHIVPKDIH